MQAAHIAENAFQRQSFSSQVSGQWEAEPDLPGFLCDQPSNMATWSPQGCLAHSCSKQEERGGGETKAGVHAEDLPSSSHSLPIGQNWSQDDFPPVKKSVEQNEEKGGVNHWGGHLLPHLHPQPQEVLCNSVNLAMVVKNAPIGSCIECLVPSWKNCLEKVMALLGQV